MKSIITLLVFTLCLNISTIQAAEKVGVLLMHGKGGTSRPKSPIGKLSSFLKGKGFLVSAPNMAWSRDRGFDKTYEESMAEIDGEVNLIEAPEGYVTCFEVKFRDEEGKK